MGALDDFKVLIVADDIAVIFREVNADDFHDFAFSRILCSIHVEALLLSYEYQDSMAL